MRYLILAAGMGKRMGRRIAGLPKCLIDIDGEPLLVRLLRQIRQCDAQADVHVVLGYRGEIVAPLVEDCRIVVNPFFDITGINASLWFARESFDRPLMVMHGDVVLSDELAADAVHRGGRIAGSLRQQGAGPTRNQRRGGRRSRRRASASISAGYSGAYAGVLKLSAHAAALFARDARRQRCGAGSTSRAPTISSSCAG